MSVDMYLHMDGVKGESTDKQFKDEMEILSFSHNLSQTAAPTASTAGGGTRGRVSFGDFTIVKPLDLASPMLFKFCASGQHINNVWIKLRRAGGEQHVYYEYHFENCVITSLTKSGDARADDTLPTETVTFNFSSMKEMYHKQERAGGAPGGTIEAGWSLLDNALI